jgi:serine-threonine kinase receptor-associated protein
MPETPKVVPLTCHGHSRPVTHLNYSAVVEEDQFYLISASKGMMAFDIHSSHAEVNIDNNPMLRDGVTGDW